LRKFIIEADPFLKIDGKIKRKTWSIQSLS